MRCEGDVANMIGRHVKVDAICVLLGCHDSARGVEDEYVETLNKLKGSAKALDEAERMFCLRIAGVTLCLLYSRVLVRCTTGPAQDAVAAGIRFLSPHSLGLIHISLYNLSYVGPWVISPAHRV